MTTAPFGQPFATVGMDRTILPLPLGPDMKRRRRHGNARGLITLLPLMPEADSMEVQHDLFSVAESTTFHRPFVSSSR